MSSASNSTEQIALQWLLTSTTPTKPTAWFVALYTAAPSDSGGGTEVSISGTNYARQSVTFSVAESPAGTWSAKNTAELVFGTASGAASNWGQVGWIGIMSAASGGTLYFWGPVNTPKTIEVGDQFRILANNITITLD